MTKRGRFGDMPPASERRGAPLPLITQPTMPAARSDSAEHVDPSATRLENPIQTRLDNPLQTLRPQNAAVLFGKTAILEREPAEIAAAPQRPLVTPEIGLTQHHLLEGSRDPRLALVINPDSQASASFRVLRHHLLEVGRPQCVVVSSAQPGEGKTTTALNLALALAECGRAKVLLVETHVRRPQLASVFKFVPPWCFAEQLAAHRSQPMLPWSLIEIPQLWLHIAAINPRIEKTQLLDGPAFAIAIERLRLGGYDHIVVDAPPVLGSADVNLMADAADAVILAVRAKRSTARDLCRAIDQIGEGKIAGTVLVQ